MPKPIIIHQPKTHKAIQSGVHQIVNAVRPTLGPFPRKSVFNQLNKMELLDDGGVIARRIIQLADRGEDVGAMLLRQVLWQVNQKVGDGCATTAVLYEAVYTQGLRYLAAGANAMRLRQHLMDALRELSDTLVEQRQMLIDVDSLRAIAYSVCYDEQMADVIAEVMDTVGQYGQVDVRKGHGRGMDHKYVEGAYWKGGVQSKEMIRNKARAVAEMEDAAIFVSDFEVKEPQELVPLMQLALRLQIKNLLVIVKSITDKAIAVFNDPRLKEKIEAVVVKIDGLKLEDTSQSHQDIAILSGATPVLSSAGQTLEHVRESDFGYARWAWADDKHFGFAGGKGDPRQIVEHVTAMRQAYDKSTDKDNRERLLERLGRLYGGSATIHVGGGTDDDIKWRRDVAERTVRAVRSALAGGVINGGGTALLRAQQMLEDRAQQQDTFEAKAAYHILAKAVEAPIRALLTNSGYDASDVMARLSYADPNHGFDLIKGEIVNMAHAGILDVADVQKEALEHAVSSAALALTIDVLFLHREPEVMTEP